MSRYQSESHYCYPGSDVLKNFFNIKDEKKLESMEISVTSDRIFEIRRKPIKGDFDLAHLKKIHEHIFQDIYPFAGELRTEGISKGGFPFAEPMYLEESAYDIFSKLKNEEKTFSALSKTDFVDRVSYYMAEINVLHPFREGNGRSQREFISSLAQKHGYILDWNKVDKDLFLQASIRSTHDYKPLANIIEQCIDKANIPQKKIEDYER